MKKISNNIAIIIAIASVVLAAASVVTLLILKISRDKAHNEKWEDYIDCGLA